jgi:hypothetical protein
MIHAWSDFKKCSIKIHDANWAKFALGLAIVALLGLNGCAGVVGASNPNAPSKSSNQPTGSPSNPTPSSTGQAQLAASPSSASFANVATGSSSSQTIALLNSGTADATISNATVTGAGFSISGLTMPVKVAAGSSATFNVVFAPSSAGPASGSVTVMSDAPNSPLTITATASAVTPTTGLSSSAASLDFGDVLLGSTNSLGATLTNVGNTNVTISSVSVTGAGFTAAGVASNTTLAPGQTANLNASFSPSAAGAVSGLITVNCNCASPVVIALAGNGAQPSAHSVALNWDPSTADVVGYYVYRALADGTYSKVNSAPDVNTQYTDTNLLSGQTYTYAITAVDADNVESDYSDPVVVVIP